jgi:hypothetical protein
VVPTPGGLTTSNRPASASTRSLSPVKPQPAPNSAPPTPSSAPVRSVRSRTVTNSEVACECDRVRKRFETGRRRSRTTRAAVRDVDGQVERRASGERPQRGTKPVSASCAGRTPRDSSCTSSITDFSSRHLLERLHVPRLRPGRQRVHAAGGAPGTNRRWVPSCKSR